MVSLGSIALKLTALIVLRSGNESVRIPGAVDESPAHHAFSRNTLRQRSECARDLQLFAGGNHQRNETGRWRFRAVQLFHVCDEAGDLGNGKSAKIADNFPLIRNAPRIRVLAVDPKILD